MVHFPVTSTSISGSPFLLSKMTAPSGKIQTVLGVVDPGEIGITYPHEHLSMDYAFTVQHTDDPRLGEKQNAGFDLKNLGWIRQYPYSNIPNLRYNDGKCAIVEELKQFKKYGGSAIVENSTTGLQRDIHFVRQASKESGVHVIAGTATERRVLEAGAQVQAALGCPVIIHPGRNKAAPFEIIRILQEAGGRIDKTVMSHLDILGVVHPGEIGITYPHEHLSMDYSFTVQHTDDPRTRDKQDSGFDLKNLGWIRQYPYSHKPNLRYNDGKRAIVEELKQFKKYGGSAIVENSTVGLQRDIEFVRQASKESEVHVIAGTGFYLDESLSSAVHQMSTEKMAAAMTRDITEGTENTDIKCGAIGELGCSWPVTATERRVLEAGAQVQASLGSPVIIHPGRDEAAPMEIVRILQEAGGQIDKTVMSHLDRTIFSRDRLLELAETGVYCEFDLFGIDVPYYQFNEKVDMPNDGTRISYISYLIEQGYGDQVLIAHDCHTLHRLEQYGGHGMCHILLNIVPMMKQRGISQAAIDKILIDNPRRWLTFL